MKRKLICIFFMLVGAAVTAGTILLSLGRPERADASPVYALIILSVITIIAAAASMREPFIFEMSAREKKFLRAYRAVNIVSIMVCFAFIVIMFFLTGYFSDTALFHPVLFILLAAAGIIVAALNLKVRPPIVRSNIAKAAVALAISAALVFGYMSSMPKYSPDESITMLRSDKENAENYIYDLSDYKVFGMHSVMPTWGGGFDESLKFNLLSSIMYEFGCDSYRYDSGGLHIMKGYIDYNPANGAHVFLRTQEQDITFGPGECPEFNWNLLYDRDGQHNAVLNLYFRELDDSNYSLYAPDAHPDDANHTYTVSSGEWDEKYKDVMYPHNFSEGEALSFLRSIGEDELKTKLLNKINGSCNHIVLAENEDGTLGGVFTDTKGKAVEVCFFGIDIAAYQNGEIDLKL